MLPLSVSSLSKANEKLSPVIFLPCVLKAFTVYNSNKGADIRGQSNECHQVHKAFSTLKLEESLKSCSNMNIHNLIVQSTSVN